MATKQAEQTKGNEQGTKVEFNADVAKELVKKHGSTSGAIRALAAEGKSRSDIAKMLGKRYQHVRNVLITPVKKPATASAPATAATK